MHALSATALHGGHTCATLAGLMLFGTHAALRRNFPMSRVDYIQVEGREWVRDPDRRYEAVQETLGPLMTIVSRIVGQVLADTPKAFSLAEDGLHRRDLPLVPREVIREAVVNALMHRNHRQHQPVQIIRYSNRIEIRNPGYSLVPDDRLGEPGSLTRNPKIAAVLHDAGLAESKGTGIRTMREGMRRANLTLPLFESDREKDTFTVTLLVHHLLGPEDVEWLAGFKDCNLDEDEARALIVVRELGALNNLTYRTIASTDTLSASGHLRRLRDLGLLEQRGRGSATYYVPADRLRRPGVGQMALLEREPVQSPGDKAVPVDTTALSAKKTSLYPGSESLSAKKTSLYPGLGSLSAKETALSAESGTLSAELPPLPAPLADAIRVLGQRADPPSVKDLILRLCQWHPLSATQLAGILNRNQRYIQYNYLEPMVQNGELGHLLPEASIPSQQFYTTPLAHGEPHDGA
ncbi:MAG: ATP-binding protein [Dehalococcoidia bacterium]